MKRKIAIKSISIFLLCFTMHLCQAQGPTVFMRIDSLSMLVGSQQNLRIGLNHSLKSDEIKINADPLTSGGWEIINESFLTHKKTDKGYLSYKDYTITCWDAGRHAIPPISIRLKANGRIDTLTTDSIVVHVQQGQAPASGPNNLKDIYRMPYPLSRLLMLIGGIIIALVVIYLLYRYFKKKKAIPEEVLPEPAPPPIPPHTIALERLKRLADKQLIEQGKTDEYQSELTHIIREFLGKTFHFNALESTTDEIITYMRRAGIYTAHLGQLSNFLRMADLVKFARAQPEEEFHRSMLEFGYRTVERLKNDGKEPTSYTMAMADDKSEEE